MGQDQSLGCDGCSGRDGESSNGSTGVRGKTKTHLKKLLTPGPVSPRTPRGSRAIVVSGDEALNSPRSIQQLWKEGELWAKKHGRASAADLRSTVSPANSKPRRRRGSVTGGKGKGRRGKRLSVTETEVMAAMSGGEVAIAKTDRRRRRRSSITLNISQLTSAP